MKPSVSWVTPPQGGRSSGQWGTWWCPGNQPDAGTPLAHPTIIQRAPGHSGAVSHPEFACPLPQPQVTSVGVGYAATHVRCPRARLQGSRAQLDDKTLRAQMPRHDEAVGAYEGYGAAQAHNSPSGGADAGLPWPHAFGALKRGGGLWRAEETHLDAHQLRVNDRKAAAKSWEQGEGGWVQGWKGYVRMGAAGWSHCYSVPSSSLSPDPCSAPTLWPSTSTDKEPRPQRGGGEGGGGQGWGGGGGVPPQWGYGPACPPTGAPGLRLYIHPIHGH